MSDGALHALSATDALAAFRARRLSPVELTQAIIARAEATEPVIGALTYRMFDAAMDAARKAEAVYSDPAGSPRALEGLCVAIKDAGHIAGHPTSAGSLTSDEAPQPASSPINERVLAAGAIAHARSATPEFSSAVFTHSRRWGVTRNPWNTDMTPGGSSGGAGAALAAGSTTLATGSDIGGSIRVPAACCGVVGYKPPKGRTPVDAPFNLDFYCHTGPMARSVGDCMVLQNVMCGPHPGDPTLVHPALTLSKDPSGIKGLRIAWSMNLGFFEVDPEVQRATMDALQVLEDLGADLVEVDLPWGWDVLEAGLAHLVHIFGASIAPLLTAQADMLTPYARAFAYQATASTSGDFLRALEVAGCCGQSFATVMQTADLFVCPTTALPAVRADFDHSQDPLIINGASVPPMLGWVMTTPFNMLSTHPVLSVPSGHAANGVPLGVQLVGRPFDDAGVFRAAYAYEAARPTLFGQVSNLGA